MRRSLAQELCDNGLVTVDGRPAKSSKEIKVGDEIVIERRTRVTRIRVVQIPATKQVSKNSAGELYKLLEETPVSGSND